MCVLYSKGNRCQLKVGTFAQNKSPSTLLEENLLANWQIRRLNSLSAIVVVMLCDVIQEENQVCMKQTPLCKIRPVVNRK